MNRALLWVQNHKKLTVIALLVIALLLGLGIYGASQKNSPPKNVIESQDSHPINSWLPVQTPQYKITYFYSQASQQYYYQITLFAIINRPSEYSSYVAQLKQYKQEALSYIRSKGGDPAKINIQYLPPLAAKL